MRWRTSVRRPCARGRQCLDRSAAKHRTRQTLNAAARTHTETLQGRNTPTAAAPCGEIGRHVREHLAHAARGPSMQHGSPLARRGQTMHMAIHHTTANTPGMTNMHGRGVCNHGRALRHADSKVQLPRRRRAHGKNAKHIRATLCGGISQHFRARTRMQRCNACTLAAAPQPQTSGCGLHRPGQPHMLTRSGVPQQHSNSK